MLDEALTPCLSRAPIDVQRGVLAWSDWLAHHGETRAGDYPLGMTECRWVARMHDVLLCGSYDLGAMNPMLLRASMFIEGLQQFPRGAVPRLTDPAYAWAMSRVGGFDLRKTDLVAYFSALDAACRTDPALCETSRERGMRELLERAWAGKRELVVVTFATRGTVADSFVVSHELLHAQYFTEPAFRAAIDAYWQALPDPERAAITARLGERYDVTDDLLLRNEFQAYVLMAGGQTQWLQDFVPGHREPLRAALRARGVSAIQTELR